MNRRGFLGGLIAAPILIPNKIERVENLIGPIDERLANKDLLLNSAQLNTWPLTLEGKKAYARSLGIPQDWVK